ncbi:MAG TPA: acetyl-CoA carboxylase biotin carboxyl carrier protein [Woeseiaceae bacterium]|jgi:acetyl-CoA carboxylase biotin carboxyl carrier protein|nr:acetyl-CoA carboxylase biotin carboxyl carrier protein [Woeseiaceae bacterium]
MVNLTDEDVREILELLDESPYDELKLETDRFSLTLKRTTAQTSWLRKGKLTRELVTQAPEPVPQAPPDRTATAGKANGQIRDIRPPMPGTFYRAPSPGAEPFTDVGRSVAEDTILGLVETMKLMNSVMAGCQGEVIEICVENGAAVEAEDTLMRIRVAANG